MSPTLVVDRSIVARNKRGNFYMCGKPPSKDLAVAYGSYKKETKTAIQNDEDKAKKFLGLFCVFVNAGAHKG